MGETPLAHSDTERAARVALSQMDDLGPARLHWLIGERTAETTIAALRAGAPLGDRRSAPPGVSEQRLAGWRSAARTIRPADLLEQHRTAGVEILIPGDPAWPFNDDPEPPVVLYVRGDPALLMAGPRIAIVGTRRCTDLGRGVANELGADLARAGLGVVSGLALGIDGAAHAGTLTARHDHQASGVPIAVVANGLDQISPRFHRAMAERVGQEGVIISEAPLGIKGDRWRFPARNRLIAGLSDVVIVVESHERGGALITVDEAIERGVPVMAVPGSIRSPASAGTNRLLADGALTLCSMRDVLDLIGFQQPSTSQGQLFAPGESPQPTDANVDPLARIVQSELSTGPISIDRLVQLSGHDLVEVMTTVQRLVAAGIVTQIGSTVCPSAEPGRQPR